MVTLREIPPPVSRPVSENRRNLPLWTTSSPIAAVDAMFLAFADVNKHLRVRVGNFDVIRPDGMIRTREKVRFRMSNAVPSTEQVDKKVITALNEETEVSAVLANKGGINLIYSQDVFGGKLHRAVHQEIVYTDNCNETGHNSDWLSIPLVLRSGTWENGTDEHSFQDTSMVEAMLEEPSDVSRVIFVPDYNTAALVMRHVYQTHGQIWTLVIPGADTIPDFFAEKEADALFKLGALRLTWAGYEPSCQRVVLTAIGSYQLGEVLKASARLAERKVPHTVIYMLEPARFREPRTRRELLRSAKDSLQAALYPDSVQQRIFVTHTRPEPLLEVLQPLNTGKAKTAALGYINHGGTLDTPGMLFVNHCTWAHIVKKAASLMGMSSLNLLNTQEIEALEGTISPEGVIL